jgi:GTPase SAR1 family protein
MGPPKQFKIVLIGDPCVGKTCLLSLFTHGTCRRHLVFLLSGQKSILRISFMPEKSSD